MGFIIVGAWAIVLTYNNEAVIIEYARSQSQNFEVVSSFAPAFIISAINVLIPIVTQILVSFEGWDYTETRIKHEIWRSFIPKVFNLLLFVALNMPDMLSAPLFKGITEYLGKDASLTSQGSCSSNVTTLSLLKLAATEVAVLIVAQHLKAIAYYIFNRLLRGQLRWKPDLHISDFTLWMLYNQGIHWLIFLLSPFFVIISPLLNLLVLLLLNRVISKYYNRSTQNNSDSIGHFIMALLNSTFFFTACIYILWF